MSTEVRELEIKDPHGMTGAEINRNNNILSAEINLTNKEIDKEIAEIDNKIADMGINTYTNIEPSVIKTEAEVKPFSARKIAICGFAESSWRLAPWNDNTWEIWGLNALHKIIKWTPNITRWFQIHPKASVFGEGLGGGADHVNFLKALKIPVYMIQHYDEIPMSVEYPLKDLCEWISIGREKERHPNFSNSISEMLALLVYEIVVCGRQVDEIGVWGVDMSHASEYCISPETKVLTADLKWIQTKNVKMGDRLIGFDEDTSSPGKKGQNRRWKESIVEGISKLTRPTYKLIMEDGSELICSAEHQWLCKSANRCHWMVTEDLIPKGMYKDDRCSHICKPLNVWEKDNSYEAGYLAAAFDGEGHITQKANNYNGAWFNIGFAQKQNAMSKAVESFLSLKGYKFNMQSEKTGKAFKYYVSGGKCEIMRFLGEFRPLRLLDKFNPNAMGAMRTTHYPALIKKEFLGEQEVIGWKTSTHTFIAEGFASHNSYQKPSCEFYLGIFEGFRQIMEIFKRCGIVSGIMKDGQFSPITLPFPSKWTLPKESLLLQNQFIYGYEEQEENADYIRMIARKNSLIQQRNTNLVKEQEAHDAQMQFLGAMQENENEIKNRGY